MGHANSSVIRELILVGFSNYPQTEIPLFVIFSLVYLASLFGNTAVIILVIFDSSLQTPMYMFLCHLAFLNVFFSIFVVPKMLFNFLANRKVISYNFCIAQTYITLFLESTECFLLAVMALDRYVAICYPLRCELPVLLHMFCADTSLLEAMMALGGAGTVLFPFLLILLSYLRILVAVMKIDCVKGRKKAFSTCASHLIVVIVYYGTGLIWYLRPKSLYSAEGDKLISVFYAVIDPMLNPFVYSLRNKEVKEGMKRVMGRHKIKIKQQITD